MDKKYDQMVAEAKRKETDLKTLPAFRTLLDYIFRCQHSEVLSMASTSNAIRVPKPKQWGSWEDIRAKYEFIHNEHHLTDAEEREAWVLRANLMKDAAAPTILDDANKNITEEVVARDSHLHVEKNDAIIERDIDPVGDRPLPPPAKSSVPSKPSLSRTVLISRHAVKELKAFRSSHIGEYFARRVLRLQAGDTSYAVRKRLNRDAAYSRPLFECKLDNGMRILYLEHGTVIQIRHICVHDQISKFVALIDKSEARLVRSRGDELQLAGSDETQYKHDDHRLELDERGNMPLRFYEMPRHVLLHMQENALFVRQWRPVLHLTARENQIVKQTGAMTIVLGRSGTGKTFCLCGRMDYDAAAAEDTKQPLRQVFLAGTRKVVEQAKCLRQHGQRWTQAAAKYLTMEAFVAHLETSALDPAIVYDRARFLSWTEFKTTFWNSLDVRLIRGNRKGGKNKSERSKEIELFPLTVWAEIRSCIKGSYRICGIAADAVKMNRRHARMPVHPQFLSRAQYVQQLGQSESLVTDRDQRERVYDIFERYERYKSEQTKWDYADRVSRLLQQLLSLSPSSQCLFDKAYVDECQDHTQVEYGILFVVCGRRRDALFLAGDTAQAVAEVCCPCVFVDMAQITFTPVILHSCNCSNPNPDTILQGVNFRFTECRSMIHALLSGDAGVDKPIQLYKNFRSHSGVLDVANLAVDTLIRHFPEFVDKCRPDCGLSKGPRPQLYRAWTYDDPRSVLYGLIKHNDRRRVLAWDHRRATLSAGPLAGLVFGVRESKGLEHSHVVIVDFFCDLPEHNQRAWKWLALCSGKPPALPVELVLQLKILYVAITRCCLDLVFLETRESPAGEAWFRWLANRKLAVARKFQQSDHEAIKMSPDEWLVEGLDHMDASKSDAHGVSTQEAMVSRLTRLEQASVCFDRAKDTFLKSKSQLHRDLLARCLEAAEGLEPKAVATFSVTLVHSLKGGLVDEAAQVLEAFVLLWRQHESGSSTGESTNTLTVRVLESILHRVRNLKSA